MLGKHVVCFKGTRYSELFLVYFSQALLRQCLRDTQALFGISRDEESLAPPAGDGGDEVAERIDAKSQAAQSQSQLLVVQTPQPNPNEVIH